MSGKVSDAANRVALHLDIRAKHLPDEWFKPAQPHDEQLVLGCRTSIRIRTAQREKRGGLLFTARLPSAALAARWTSVSWLLRRNRIGSNVSLPTCRTSFSVISANARAALRWRSIFSEKESVVRALRGDPVKKLVVVRSKIPAMGSVLRWSTTSNSSTTTKPLTFKIL